MSKIKISKVSYQTFDCIYCSDDSSGNSGIDIPVPKSISLHEEKFYRIKCPYCGMINYVLPVIQIEPVPYTYEDYKNMKDDKGRILKSIYSNYQ